MTKRFELILPADRRDALDALAAQLDTTASELARLGIVWVLANRDFLLRGKPPTDRVAA